MQQHLGDSYGTKETSSFSKIFSKGSKNEQSISSSVRENAFPNVKRGKQTRLEMPTPTVPFDESEVVRNPILQLQVKTRRALTSPGDADLEWLSTSPRGRLLANPNDRE